MFPVSFLQYIRACILRDVSPMLSLVPRCSLQVEILDVSGRGTRVQGGTVPWLPPKPQSARLSLWDIETHLQIKVDSAANVNAGDLIKVCSFCIILKPAAH